MPLTISAAVEGLTDEEVVRKLIAHVGAEVGIVYGKKGKQHLLQKIPAYNHAARQWPWLVLVDLDQDADCAPPFRSQWLPQPSPFMCFRIAVRAVEAWLLADAEALAQFLGVAQNKVPKDPETLDDPKAVMVELARASRRREIREDMVPRPAGGRKEGPAYVSRLLEFTKKHWRPGVAAGNARSLQRAIACLRRLTGGNP